MAHSIHPDTRLGEVHLTVADLDRSLAFYQDVLGLAVRRPGPGADAEGREPREPPGDAGDAARLGAGKEDLLVLVERPEARSYRGTSGLYHYALLVPTRKELARSLRRLAETGTPLQGIVDHWISEAIYLADPDGNGIEIARDRHREAWPPMETLAALGNRPVDVDGLLAEIGPEDESWPAMDPATKIGHIHLHVADLVEAERFYRDALGFDVMARYGTQAAFLSAGAYHHHIGINTWAGVGVPPPPPDAVGLRHFVVRLPDQEDLAKVADRLHRAGHPLEERTDGLLVRDPSHNGIVLTATPETPELRSDSAEGAAAG